MSIGWKYIKPLDNKSAVKDFLSKNHIIIPEPLVGLLEKNNGGRPSEKEVITETKREYVFKCLMSFNSDDNEAINRFYPELFSDTSLFPFGSDSAGNFVCYNTKTQSYVLYNHETGKVEKIIECPFLPQL